tara:strand:+ start:761 stop:949 length:189 start_codon:yes stop_codon:yes gene_type:complete
MSHYEDSLYEIYQTIKDEGLKKKFDQQTKKMESQNKHKYKNVLERWEYALYRVKGGPSKDSY